MVVLDAQYAANNIGISGFKYVLGQKVSKFRRFVWLLVILLASAWMIWNIQGRVSYFLSRPSAVKTQTKFKDKIMFPKVTLCNQNMFRSSQVYFETHGQRTSPTLYEAINSYLHVLQDDTRNQSLRQNVVDKTGTLLSDKNIKHFYRRAAHQKTVFIQSCIWNGRQCGPENFTEVLTNMGVCYQFNTSPDMIVEKANKRGGLNVILLVEQYDYMQGQTAAGALVVITHQNETEALAKEQGIGVTVGQSVSIGLQQSEVIDLPPPYGACASTELGNYSPDVPYTHQKCHLNCLTSFIKRKCGCIDIYMPGQDTTYCSLLQSLLCVRPNEELFYRTGVINTCTCTSPCHSITFSSTISLVQFSHSFVRSLSFTTSPALLAAVNTAIQIQAWGFLNTMNTNVTDSIAELGTPMLDFKVKTDRLIVALNKFLTQVEYLIHFVSENNLTNLVMRKIKPEASVTLEELHYATSRINRTVDSVHNRFLNNNFWSRDILTEHREHAIVWLAMKYGFGIIGLASVGTTINQMFFNFIKYHEILFNFTCICTAIIQNMNMSEENSSCLKDDTLKMVSDLKSADANLANRLKTIHDLYSSEIRTLKEIGKMPYKKIQPDFYSDNMAKVKIYFKDLGVQESQKAPAYSVEGLVCDIGGSIGLCLGGSILTLFEFIDILAILCTRQKNQSSDVELDEKEEDVT